MPKLTNMTRLFFWLLAGGVVLLSVRHAPCQTPEEERKEDEFREKNGLRPHLIRKQTAEKWSTYLFNGPYGLPKPDDIKSIRAEVSTLSADPFRTIKDAPDIPPFEVPEKFFKRFMALFKDPIIDTYPLLDLPEAGTLLITTKNGRTRRICWYAGSHTPLVFSLQGTRCTVEGKDWDAHPSYGAGEMYGLIEVAYKAYKNSTQDSKSR